MLSGRGWLLCGAVALAAVVVGTIVWRQYFDAYHLAAVQPGVLYRDGVRTRREFITTVRLVKPKTVVSLIDDGELQKQPFVDEMAICREQGIDVVRIPVTLGGWPDTGQIRQFLDLTQDVARRPVLVHCAQGVRRTGMMVAAFQESVLNFDPAKAKAAMLTFGHSDRTVNDVQHFIDIYDPANRAMTEQPAPSKE